MSLDCFKSENTEFLLVLNADENTELSISILLLL